ncbi:D-alanine--poly(phosphoribitol) ligase subunit 1 [Vagococcus penaei]|uniref:D-alanine--D-alanyl carrier protein ligase n=1 Tax=Vagococcus penaei TaxID=633807 RepID=A0A1Q2D457_9ENTE|nr:D-alanine--poly(phosphoribitol) ligase subunit DltA [Vagococcus penaei]AQP53077.1 D-alanine--poly(phosphoribitol) ligase subunit 1 [Vagococcus penaei]RSU06060.1 D-alanine--poly(phosphoribitol) ligase subunit 1 [Vagococcus penaei]
MNHIIKKIQDWSQAYPDRLCFDGVNDQLTYQELEHYSNQLAEYLAVNFPNKQGIVVYGGQTSQMIISFLACTKSGHGYIPVDQHTPVDRLEMIVKESGATAVISVAEWPLASGSMIVEQEQLTAICQGTANTETNVVKLQPVLDEAIYYTIYTSGTTGKPKGVQITYNNLISYTDWMVADFHLTEGQRFLCQAPFSFDLSVMDLYPALLTGGTLVPLEKDVVDSFPTLFKMLPTLDLNVWVSTPSMMEICLLSPEFDSEHLPTLENFQFCGEELPRKTAIKLMERFPNAYIFNTYGPTEATVAITEVQLTSEIIDSVDRLPLGRVKSDTRLLIMSDAGDVLPDGELGEIVIVGPSVSVGYFNNPEKTAEAFFTYEGERAYHTGDVGVIKDGYLFYKGRLDFQVKWNGYRIELGDIDHHLLAIEGIRNACVVPKYNRLHKVQQLIAYVVVESSLANLEQKEFVKELKAQLSQTVMDYMVPQKFVLVDALPLTSNGKVDRKKLIQEVNGQ